MEPKNPYANLGKQGENSEAPSQQQSPPAMVDETGLTHNDKQMGMWCHLIPLIVSFFAFPLGFIGPLVIMNTGLPRSAFVLTHAKEAINAQISLVIYGLAGVLIALVTLGLGLILVVPALIAMMIAYVIFGILASIAANNGQPYRYPLCIRFVK